MIAKTDSNFFMVVKCWQFGLWGPGLYSAGLLHWKKIWRTRLRRLRLARTKNQKGPGAMPADREHLRLAGIERAHQFVVIGDRVHGLLIHLFDHIALLQ